MEELTPALDKATAKPSTKTVGDVNEIYTSVRGAVYKAVGEVHRNQARGRLELEEKRIQDAKQRNAPAPPAPPMPPRVLRLSSHPATSIL